MDTKEKFKYYLETAIDGLGAVIYGLGELEQLEGHTVPLEVIETLGTNLELLNIMEVNS